MRLIQRPALMFAALLAAAPAMAKNIVVYEDVPELRAPSMQALQALYAACPQLHALLPKVLRITLWPTVIVLDQALRDLTGWTAYLDVEVTFIAGSRPFGDPALDGYARVTHFALGAGRHPGIVPDGAGGNALCALRPATPRTFIPDPDLRVLRPLDREAAR